MQLKKYIKLEPYGKSQSNRYHGYQQLKLRVLNGTTGNDLADALSTGKSWVPQNNERVYFIPGCTVPRFKVREKFSVTNKPEHATAVFVGTKLDMDMSDVSISKYYSVPINAVKEWLEDIYGKEHFMTVKFKSIALNCEDIVLVSIEEAYSVLNCNPEEVVPYDPNCKSDKWYLQEHMKYEPGYEQFSTYSKDCQTWQVQFYTIHNAQFFQRITAPIYSQEEILGKLNTDKMVIDETKYQEFRKMANTGQDDNIILMMELMANTNYQKSCVYLLLLLKEYNTKISTLDQAEHVNFKSLLAYFGLNVKTFQNISIETMMKVLKKHKLFTRINIQRITQHFTTSSKMPNDVSAFETQHFQVGPVLKPEAESLIDDDTINDAHEIEIPEEKTE